MKKLFLAAFAAFALVSANAQTDTNTFATQFKATTMGFVDNVTSATNWNMHVEALYVEAWKSHYGVREGFDYQISDGMYSTLSLVEGNNTLYGIAGNFGLKQHWTLFGGKLTIVTAEKVGVINTLSGQKFGSFTVPGDATHSGDWGGTIGSDVVFNFNSIYAPDVIVGFEKWSNQTGNVYSAGVHWPLPKVFALFGIH